MARKQTVLLVDDAHDMLDLLRRNMESLGLETFAAINVLDAIELLDTTEIDFVITDLKMPGVSGVQLVKYISLHFPELPVLVISGYPNVQDAVQVMKYGAIEYLTKPFTNDELSDAVQKLRSSNTLTTSHIDEQEDVPSFHGLIGRSKAMQDLFATIAKTKNNKATVLITGESGTGKEMVARAIHYNSNSTKGQFVAVNCGAIPDQLLESELFGHLKGAFTGATQNRAGFFQAADGGTLFLDEISNATLSVQGKLLRAIQEKEVVMLGGTKPQKIDVRLISASNSFLPDLIENKTFRADLFYRLNVISIHIPPLRERKEDIPALLNHFNQKFSNELGKKELKLTNKVYAVLAEYSWPGNIRELENFVHRAVIMQNEKLSLEHLPSYLLKSDNQINEEDLSLSLAQMQRVYINKVLKANNNNKSKTAQILEIDRKTLNEKLK